jgi:tRNA pseudouridine55 synthase
VGRATRLAQFFSGAEKEYEAVIRLGYATDTGDVTGTRVSDSTTETQRCTEIHREDIETAMASLRGEIEQIPPMYSAKKIGGRKLYELARRGEQIERASVRVQVSEFVVTAQDDALKKENTNGTRDLSVRVACSAGTYIRTLAEDFGKQLGVGAHVAELRRTRAGEFKIGESITLDRLSEVAQSGSVAEVLISPDATLSSLPAMDLEAEAALRITQGIDVRVEEAQRLHWPDGQPVRLRNSDGELIAVGIYNAQQLAVHPKVVILN